MVFETTYHNLHHRIEQGYGVLEFGILEEIRNKSLCILLSIGMHNWIRNRKIIWV